MMCASIILIHCFDIVMYGLRWDFAVGVVAGVVGVAGSSLSSSSSASASASASSCSSSCSTTAWGVAVAALAALFFLK